MSKITPFCGLLLLAFPVLIQAQQAAPAALPRTAAPENAVVYFLSPANGATVTSPVTIRFGLRGMGVAPAGVTNPNTGHHHLLVDVAASPPDNLPPNAAFTPTCTDGTCRDGTLVCSGTFCRTCGGQSQPCCAGDTCAEGFSCLAGVCG